MSVLEKEADGGESPNIWELLLRNADFNSITTCFLSESKAVGEKLLAHNASDKDKMAVAHFLYHTGAVSIQVKAALQENKSQPTDSVPGNGDNRQRISSGVDAWIKAKDDSPGVTAQSSSEDPANPPLASVRDGSGAMDDDTSDDNGYAIWDQDPGNEEEATTKENVEGIDRPDGGQECQNCHAWFRHTWDFDIHRLRCPAQHVPSVYVCYQCDHIRKHRKTLIRHLRKVHNVPFAEIQAKIKDLKIPKSDIASKKIQIDKVRKSNRREGMKSYACDRCDFIHKGQKPIIKHLQEEHEFTFAETLSKYRELEVPVSMVGTSKEQSKRAPKSHKTGRPRKIIGKENMQKAKKRKTARSLRNSSRNSPSVSQPEECSGAGIVMDLDWKDTTQEHGSMNDEEGKCRRVLPEKVNLRKLCIKLRDIGKTKGDTAFEANSQVVETAEEPVGHSPEISLFIGENSDINEEKEAKQEENEDGEQSQAGEEAVTDISQTEAMEPGEEAVTDISQTEAMEDVISNSSKSTRKSGRKPQEQCEFCGVHFKSEYYCRQHISREHIGLTYTCSTCNKVFDTRLGFQRHVRDMHKNKADDKVFQCDVCYKTFCHKSSYYAHKYIHGDKFACKVCGKRHQTRRAMETHVNRDHTKEKLFSCVVCNKAYYDVSMLRQHMHTHSERQYECDICDKKFFFPWAVHLHKRDVHTERSHLCETCGGSFKSKDILRQHRNTVHSTECRFKCDVCGRGFKRSSHLYAHQKCHTDIKPYACEICAKTFRTRRNLKVHTNWHNNVRDYVCEACGKAFLTKANLDKHYFTHTGRKPHPCTECEQQFVDLPGLRHHLLKKHDIHLEHKVPRKSSVLTMNEPPLGDPPSAQQEPQIDGATNPPRIPSAPRTDVELVHSSVVSSQPAQFDVVSSAMTANGIGDVGLTTEQVSENLQSPAMTAQSLPQHSRDVDDNMMATEALMQIMMS